MTNNFFSKFFKKTVLLPEKQMSDYFDKQDDFKEIFLSFEKGDLRNASSIALTKKNEFKDSNIQILVLDSFLIYFQALVYKGDIFSANKLIEEYKELINKANSSSEEIVREKMTLFYSLLGIMNQNQGNYSESLKNFEQAKLYSDKLNNIQLQLNVNINIANNLVYENNTNEAIKSYLASLEISEKSQLTKSTFIILNNLGLSYLYEGDLQKSKESLEKAYELLSDTNHKIKENALNFNSGLYDFLKGNIQDSNSKFESCLNFYNDNEFNYELGLSYINLSSLSEFKGDVVRAQSDLSNSYSMFNEINNNHLMNICNNNLANLSLMSGDFESANNAYSECMDNFLATNYYSNASISIFNLISLAVLENNEELKEQLETKILEISTKHDNPLLNLVYQVSKALILKRADRMVKLAEAQQIFANLANTEKDLTINHEFQLIALKNLSEMLIQELSTSGDEEVIEELKEVLDKILDIANKHNSQLLKAESYLIQSKLDLLDLKLNESRTLLGQAQVIAEEKGLISLAIFISREYDTLLNQLGKIDQSSDKQLSMNERLEMAELEGMVNKLIRKRADIPDITGEEPVMFLIIAMSGMSVFSKIFTDEELMDEQLIGGFITAINVVTQQAFSGQDAIDGIRHQDFTLLLKYLGDTKMLCVYVFKGQTYFAMQKLNTFIETVQYSEPMEVLNDANDVGMIISEDPGLLNLVTRVFETTGDDTPQKISTNFFSQKVTATINQGILLPGIEMSFNNRI